MVENEQVGDKLVVDQSGVSDQTITIFTWVVVAGLCQTIGVFGVVTNIVNIMCFVKQGFKEPVNVSLLGLAVSDLGCLITQIMLNIMYTLAASKADHTFDALDVAYLTAAMPHLAFNRVTSWITAIITMERCLCITVPLKVKNIITTKRVWILISFVYIIFLFSGAPVFVVNRLDSKYFPAWNRTRLGLVSTADRGQVEGITFAINSLILPFIALIIIVTCTVVLVVNLQKRIQWRKTSTAVEPADISRRDQKVAKMVVMISVLFICCLVPICLTVLAMGLEPRLNVGGDLLNISKLLANCGLLLECINSSANILIYYHMSSKYRDTVHIIFSRNKLAIK